MYFDGFTPSQKALFKKLKTPERIQQFVEELDYNLEPDGPTCRSPKRVLELGEAHCMEGALLAAAALRWHGHPPLLVDLEAVRDDDHVLAVFRFNGHWGAIAKSNYSGLRFREPVYRTLRELAMSYFEHYFNLAGEKTLRRYSRPVNLKRFDSVGWMTSPDDVWEIPNYLCEIRHIPLLAPAMEGKLTRVDARLMAAGKVGMVQKVVGARSRARAASKARR